MRSDSRRDAEPLVTEEDLAETYSSPYDFVDQYREAIDIHRKTGLKSSAVSSRMEGVPRSRIRTWIEGGKPDVLRGIETAREHGWLDLDYDDSNFRCLNRLTAWIFSGGSITKSQYKATFSVEGSEERKVIESVFESLGLGFDTVKREAKADEAVPDDATLLGRVLSCLGAPVGTKAHGSITLPEYLDTDRTQVKHDFVRIYLFNRAHSRGEARGRGVGIREERPREYLNELAGLLREFVDDGEVSVNNKNVYVSKKGTRELRESGLLGGDDTETLS
ncbi:MAG: hypothetical protein SV253_06990 [Halobacteria archaeon]|nr:hypothetical protein [Halobacteria archaeon]